MATPHTRAVPSSHTHFKGVIFEHLLGGLLDLQIDNFWCRWKDFTSYFQKLGVRIKKLFALEFDCSKLSACSSDFFWFFFFFGLIPNKLEMLWWCHSNQDLEKILPQSTRCHGLIFMACVKCALKVGTSG